MDICSFSSFAFNCYIVLHCLNISIYPFLCSDRFAGYFLLWTRLHQKKEALRMSPCTHENYSRSGDGKLSVKCQIVDISGFAGQFSVAILQFCYCSVKVTMEMIWAGLRFNKTLQKKAVGRIWNVGYSLHTKVYTSKSGIAWLLGYCTSQTLLDIDKRSSKRVISIFNSIYRISVPISLAKFGNVRLKSLSIW